AGAAGAAGAPAARVDAARDRRVRIVGLAGEDERADIEVREPAGGRVASRPQGLAAEVAAEPDPGAVRTRAEARAAAGAGERAELEHPPGVELDRISGRA